MPMGNRWYNKSLITLCHTPLFSCTVHSPWCQTTFTFYLNIFCKNKLDSLTVTTANTLMYRHLASSASCQAVHDVDARLSILVSRTLRYNTLRYFAPSAYHTLTNNRAVFLFVCFYSICSIYLAGSLQQCCRTINTSMWQFYENSEIRTAVSLTILTDFILFFAEPTVDSVKL